MLIHGKGTNRLEDHPLTRPFPAGRSLVKRPPTDRAPTLIRAALIILACAWIYWPALRGGWIWDDVAEVSRNPVLRDPNALAKIWISPVTPDYFPLKTTFQVVMWGFWGDSPVGFHVATLVLHLFNALLFWRLLQRLGLRLAWLGGLLLVVHPLVVESVAWIAELKNTLSLAFLLPAMIAYLNYDSKTSGPRRAKSEQFRSEAGGARCPQRAGMRPASCYCLSLACFLLATLSKSSVVMFPFVILLYGWWKRSRISWRDFADSLPFFGISLILGLVTVSFQHHRALASWTIPLGGLDSRIACAGLAMAFYFLKSIVPVGLLPMYPQWSVNPPSLVQFLPWPILAVALGWFWTRRATWGRPVLFGVGFFVLNLLPVLGFVSMAYMHIAWVADHFAYLPLLGLIGLGVAGLEAGANRLAAARPGLLHPAAGIVLFFFIALACASRSQAALYGDEEALWSYTLRNNPSAWMAHINLGQFLAQAGRSESAMQNYTEALRIRPDLPEAYYNRGSTLLHLGRLPDAIADFEQALRLQPRSPDVLTNLGNALARSDRLSEAISRYEQALQIEPGAVDTRANLLKALLLLVPEMARVHRLPDAMAACEEVLRLDPDNPEAHANLGNLYFMQGQLPEAVMQYEATLRVHPDAAEIRTNLELAQRALQQRGQ